MDDPLQLAIEQGKEAEVLMSSDAFKSACKRARAMAIEEWSRTHAGEVALREAAYHAYKAIDRIEQALTAVKGDGDMARKTLASLQQQKQPNPMSRRV